MNVTQFESPTLRAAGDGACAIGVGIAEEAWRSGGTDDIPQFVQVGAERVIAFRDAELLILERFLALSSHHQLVRRGEEHPFHADLPVAAVGVFDGFFAHPCLDSVVTRLNLWYSFRVLYSERLPHVFNACSPSARYF
jgi:hypothetical protein